jgi:predicted restriction endonuclease
LGAVRAAKAKKKFTGRCLLCGEADQSLLDSHRVLPGEQGGQYRWENVMPLCSNCHRRVHAGAVKVKGRYLSTGGYWLWLVEEAGEERWVEDR